MSVVNIEVVPMIGKERFNERVDKAMEEFMHQPVTPEILKIIQSRIDVLTQHITDYKVIVEARGDIPGIIQIDPEEYRGAFEEDGK